VATLTQPWIDITSKKKLTGRITNGILTACRGV